MGSLALVALGTAMAACAACPAPARPPADEPARAIDATERPEVGADEPAEGDVITVTGWRLRALDEVAPTASRLGLSIRDIPATVDRIGAEEMLTRGFRTVEEATVNLPGVTSGGTPGNPALFSIRGFTGSQITILKNGLYLGPANMVNRPGNTFNLAGIELIKGPASVLFGQGAIGGAVNIIDKRPDLRRDETQALASYGGFDTLSLGVGGNRVLSDAAAMRVDVSYHRTGGFVDDAPASSLNATGSLLVRASANLSVRLDLDYLQDVLSPYFGTPLVSGAFAAQPIRGILSAADGSVVDRRLRFRNFNVEDQVAESWQVWPRLTVDWRPTESVTIANTTYWFHAQRRWINAETFVFNPGTNLIDRDRFFVFHSQDLIGNQLSATFGQRLFGLTNRLVVGLDYSHLDFVRTRGFPDGDSVDPLQPARGRFGPLVARVSPTRWDQGAIFAEDVLSLAPTVKLITGLRAERLWLTRENFNVDGRFNPNTSFERTYELFNWRAGLTWDVRPNVTAYASYSTGRDPVGSNIFLVNAGENFDLSSARQYEAGVKADLANGRGSLTLAAYDIERRNILTLVGRETLAAAGVQRSRGLEATGEFKPTDQWTLIANAAYVDARYGSFIDPSAGVDASGNRPANVPDWTANLWTTVRGVGGVPLELGGGLRYVGERFGNTANSLRLRPYMTGIVYATYELSPRLALTGRINNLWDETFVQWADVFYPSQVQLGEPRRFEISLLGRF